MNLNQRTPVMYCADGETALLRMAPPADLKLALERVSSLVTAAYRLVERHDTGIDVRGALDALLEIAAHTLGTIVDAMPDEEYVVASPEGYLNAMSHLEKVLESTSDKVVEEARAFLRDRMNKLTAIACARASEVE